MSQRDAYYDGIRAIAIIPVVGFHWGLSPGLRELCPGGYVGVDIFFVLSGFIITTVLSRAGSTSWRSYGDFLARRVRRLYPALLAMLGIGGALLAIAQPTVSLGDAARSAVESATQASAILSSRGTAHYPVLFGQTWSLADEWFFYLLWPLVLLLARRGAVSPQRLAGLAAVAVIGLYVAARGEDTLWFYYGPTSRAAQLLAGAAVALWLRSGRYRPRLPAPIADLLLVAALATVGAWVGWGPPSGAAPYPRLGFPLVTLAAAVLCAAPALTRDRTLAQRTVAAPPLAFVGLVSYSLYLWHFVLWHVFSRDDLRWPPPVLLATTAVTTIAVTLLSYRLLERPFLRPRRRPAVAAAADPLSAG